MHLTRAAYRLGKSLCTNSPWLRPGLASLQHFPCKAAMPHPELRRYGNKMHESSDRDNNPLYLFEGVWRQKKVENLDEFLALAGVAKPLYQTFRDRKIIIEYRQGEDGDWETVARFHKAHRRIITRIQFNQEIDYGEIGIPIVAKKYPDSPLIRERLESYQGPNLVINVIHEVTGDTMTVNSRIGGTNVIFKMYFTREK